MNGALPELAQLRIEEYRREAERVHRVSRVLRERKTTRPVARTQWSKAFAIAAAVLHLNG